MYGEDTEFIEDIFVQHSNPDHDLKKVRALCVKEGDTERERDRERQRDTERGRQRQRETDRDRERQRDKGLNYPGATGRLMEI